jgi:FolB domain-containing protein
MNRIRIDSLRARTFIGVPDEERASAQEVEIDLLIDVAEDFSEMEDDISHTIDYALVCERVTALAASRPRKLVETLAAEIAQMALEDFGAAAVEGEVRKFILPATRHVAVSLSRRRS